MAVESTPSSVKDKMDVVNVDVERHAVAEAHLKNTTIRHIAWKGVTVTVKDRETKLPKDILENVEGIVEAGVSPYFSFPSWDQHTE
jgi:hypothetical protein